MQQHIKNFSLAEYFGHDGEDPKHGPWKDWIVGDDQLFGEDFAVFTWWHLAGLMCLFVEIEEETLGRKLTPLSFDKSMNDYLSLVETHTGDPLYLVHPFRFESMVESVPNLTANSENAMLLAYGVWCVDRLIDALRDGDARTASFASSIAVRSLELVYENCAISPEGRARANSRRQSEIARKRHAESGKRRDLESVKDCWKEWQRSPSNYRSKAAFARDMLSKFENLASTKYIEDLCREWERENGRNAGKLRIVPVK
ncbi:hypothetical protein [Paraburkholderia nodosa]|uniref:hypothetical protein n=1 Tax=Paraburkholderia nodosa TaxID=392320 RepID=UPI000841C5D4|nr:hypothetical protein [Paraburkholderia nodosa]